MLIFPQLSTGAIAQYPIRRRHSERTILNVSDDGSVIALWDESASQVKWDLRFVGLTDQESLNISSFFELCEGPLQSFLFLDPAANLFAYSEDFTQPVWQSNSLLAVQPGVVDPYGTTRATQVTNNSLGTLSLTQTVNLPGSVSCAFSVYLRASLPTDINLIRTDGSTVQTTPVIAGLTWTRFSLASQFASSISTSCDFSIELPADQSVQVFGCQLEPQNDAGIYVMSTNQTGVYPSARFDGNNLKVIATGPGQSSLDVSIISPATQ